MIGKNLRHALRIWAIKAQVAARFDVLLEPAVVIKHPARLSFGKKCTLQAGSYVYGSRSGAEVVFGDWVVVAAGAMVLGEGGVRIGDGTHLGPHVVVTSQYGDGKGERITDTPTVKTRPIVIGRGCWIGSGAVIMPGVVLGDRCTVAPGAVVYGRFPDDATLAGNPARVTRRVTRVEGSAAVPATGSQGAITLLRPECLAR